MKRIKLFLALTAGAFLLCSCGGNTGTSLPSPIIIEEETHSNDPVKGDEEGSNKPSTPIITEPDLPPEEGMVRSKLTNEWISPELANRRPLAVMTPNQSAAIPHYNLSKASILYEANVEGNMSRMLAIYEDWDNLEKIGNVRSLRAYYAVWATEWDAILVHYGGPWMIDEVLERPNHESIDGTNTGGDAFFRSTDRSSPHNAYANGPGIKQAVIDKGMSLEDRGLTDSYHYKFTAKDKPNTLEQYETGARNATKIDMTGAYPLTRCYFEYNENDGLYYRSQHLSGASDGPHIDAVNGEQLTFSNVIVQFVHQYAIDDHGYLAIDCSDSGKDGWFFTRGKGIHINWEKGEDDFSATKYYDDQGNEIVLNTGKTMVCIVEIGDTVSFK